MLILCTKHKEHMAEMRNDPPYDRNGSGTPVRGIRPNRPPKLTNI